MVMWPCKRRLAISAIAEGGLVIEIGSLSICS